jgi:hypothetical protein
MDAKELSKLTTRELLAETLHIYPRRLTKSIHEPHIDAAIARDERLTRLLRDVHYFVGLYESKSDRAGELLERINAEVGV